MEKLDLAKQLPQYYKAKVKPEIVTIAKGRFLQIEGQGAPDGEAFAKATEALYTTAYSVKSLTKSNDRDFVVAKLEGLWWVEGEKEALETPREEWQWKLLLQMPDFVSQEDLDSARQIARDKKKDLTQLEEVVFGELEEGKSAQILHVGPYADEPATIQALLELIDQSGLAVSGLHHEIYLSDPRKVAPDKMKTILRYPVK